MPVALEATYVSVKTVTEIVIYLSEPWQLERTAGYLCPVLTIGIRQKIPRKRAPG